MSNPIDIANGFNKYFTEIGPQLAAKIPESQKSFTDYLGDPNENDFKFCELTEARILNFIKKMKPKSSFGEDAISNNVLKIIAPSLIKPLTHLINISLTTGFFPDQLKIAKIIPIYKDSNKHEFSNYRPISLLNSLSRLVDSIVCFQLTAFSESFDFFYKHQYDFHAKRSSNL